MQSGEDPLEPYVDDYVMQQQQQQQQQTTWGPCVGSSPENDPQGVPPRSGNPRMPFKPPQQQQGMPSHPGSGSYAGYRPPPVPPNASSGYATQLPPGPFPQPQQQQFMGFGSPASQMPYQGQQQQQQEQQGYDGGYEGVSASTTHASPRRDALTTTSAAKMTRSSQVTMISVMMSQNLPTKNTRQLQLQLVASAAP